ncbi:MAG: M50 family metallopeptidase [Thermoanaerobaculia bacterium]|nr:M50 family metallopeptidase [Thermoanaerobaculia bacterium]
MTATLLLYVIPFGDRIAYPLMLLSTLAHEAGHGLMALLVGGSFHRLTVWPDGSGVAHWSAEPSRLRLAAVAAGGLVGPALAAALGFHLGRRPGFARRTLGAVAIVLAVALILLVRGLFAWLFVATVAALCALVARRADAKTARLVLIFLSVQLALSVFSRADYLFTPVATTASGSMPSDTALIAQALWLPYWFWGTLCGAVSVFALIYGIRAYWR